MVAASALPVGLVVVALALAGILGAIVPTGVYLYVEPRGRRQWAVPGDTSRTRRAPLLVRFTAWASFFLGQAALPWLLLPVAAAVLVQLQIRLGAGGPTALGITALLGMAALAQALFAARLLPLGVRLLVGDVGVAPRARRLGGVSAVILAGALGAGAAMYVLPGLVHPVLRATLAWALVRPIVAFALASLVHAFLLHRCARWLALRGRP